MFHVSPFITPLPRHLSQRLLIVCLICSPSSCCNHEWRMERASVYITINRPVGDPNYYGKAIQASTGLAIGSRRSGRPHSKLQLWQSAKFSVDRNFNLKETVRMTPEFASSFVPIHTSCIHTFMNRNVCGLRPHPSPSSFITARSTKCVFFFLSSKVLHSRNTICSVVSANCHWNCGCYK